MSLQAQFRQYLAAADIDGCRRLWEHAFPNMPQAPVKDRDVLVQIHLARTTTSSIDFKLRAYSHRWLTDNGYPSLLPDELKPKAERIYPRIAEAVGIAVMANSPVLKPVAFAIQKAMGNAVEDAFAEGRGGDTAFVTARMNEAREKEKKYFSDLLNRGGER
jgi:hypothetical protein